MPVTLTICRLCARSRPDFLRTLGQLLAAYPDDLVVEELECMAACDDVPAIMVETDYIPQARPSDLISSIERHLGIPVRASRC